LHVMLMVMFTKIQKTRFPEQERQSWYIPQRTAQGINLAAFVVSAASSMLIHLRRRRVDLHLLWGALPGCLGAFFGARLAARLPSATLRILLGGLLTVAGVVGLIGALRGKRGENGRKTKK